MYKACHVYINNEHTCLDQIQLNNLVFLNSKLYSFYIYV